MSCKASGTLVVPKWQSSPFWPLLFQSDLSCYPYVSEIKDPKVHST